jgi:ribosome-associated protein
LKPTPLKSLPTVTADESEPPSEALRLDQFLKLSGLAGTGGQAKVLIQAGEVKVNGAVETRRRRKLAAGDVVELAGQRQTVEPLS